jgi:hypothetical protein
MDGAVLVTTGAGLDEVESLFSKRWLFSTDVGLSREEQSFLIDFCKERGTLSGPHPVTGELMWKGYLAHAPVFESMPTDLAPDHYGRWTYLARYDASLRWSWRDDSCRKIVESFMDKLNGIYKAVTRVNILLQRPGIPLVPHRDLRAGEFYPDMKRPEVNAIGTERLRYIGDAWFAHHAEKIEDSLHRDQKYLSLKVPLTERPGNPGNPFVVANQRKIFYDSLGNALFLNEAEMQHGADPVDFYRGVVFIDGILDLQRLSDLRIRPVKGWER